jgi:glycerophosphoryl diester phosphodiesterase
MAAEPSIFNIAHRGARSLAPENTMAAIEKAWEVGAHGIEVDIRATLDGELILLHDESLRRTTNVDQLYPERQNDPVSAFLLDEVSRLDAGSWFIRSDPFGQIAAGNVSPHDLARIKYCTVPTLAEVLEFIKERAWYINIELKQPLPPSALEQLLALIEMIDLPIPLFAISSFNHAYLRQLQVGRPTFEYNALIGASKNQPQDWGNYEFETYNADFRFTDEKQITRARARNCRVNLYTVNDSEQMKRFLTAGVEKIITDYPQILAAIDR